MSSPEVNALQDLRKGSLYAILSTILLSIAIVFLLASLAVISALLPFASSSSSAYLGSSFASIGSLAGVIVLEIIALIFTILSVLKLRSGFRGLEATGKDVGGVTGTTLWIIGMVLTLTLILAPIGALLVLAGLIIVGIAIRRVGQIYNVSNINIGGILIAIGAIIPFLAFVGFILTYIGLGKLLNTMGPGGQPPSGPSQGATPTQ